MGSVLLGLSRIRVTECPGVDSHAAFPPAAGGLLSRTKPLLSSSNRLGYFLALALICCALVAAPSLRAYSPRRSISSLNSVVVAARSGRSLNTSRIASCNVSRYICSSAVVRNESLTHSESSLLADRAADTTSRKSSESSRTAGNALCFASPLGKRGLPGLRFFWLTAPKLLSDCRSYAIAADGRSALRRPHTAINVAR